MVTPLDVKFGKIKAPAKGVVVVLSEKNLKLSPTAQAYDEQTGGQITSAAKFAKFSAKKKSFLSVLSPANTGVGRLIVLGIGDANLNSTEDWLAMGGALRGQLKPQEAADAVVIIDNEDQDLIDPDQIAQLGLGLFLRSYKFEKHKTKSKHTGDQGAKQELKKVTIQCPVPTKTRSRYEQAKALGEGVFIARDLVNEPSNILDPKEFAARAKALEAVGVEVEILDEKALTKLGAGALLAVGRGSAKPSYLAVMKWYGARSKRTKPIAFVGKGVTFDSGGISIKPSGGMEDMKGDMGGAACVVGLMHALASRKAKANVIGVIGLVENMVGPDAYRPGDVLTSMSGQTIEVLNTDAEGRLVLADALWYTQDKYKPTIMIDLATLTGAILVALGKEYAGLFSNDDTLAEQISAAGTATGEKVWRLPLGPKFDKMIDSKNADMKNIGGRYAGSTTAAQFLQRFVNGTAWAHLDIAGTAMASLSSDINQSWGSGYGVRLLDRFVQENYE